jgi:uncharacterized membrane protein YesL
MLVSLLIKKHSNIQFQLLMAEYVWEGKKIVCFYLKKIVTTNDSLFVSALTFMCTLHSYQPNLGASSQIQISNSIKLSFNIYTSEYSYTLSITILLFSSSLIQHSSKNVLHMSGKVVTIKWRNHEDFFNSIIFKLQIQNEQHLQ